MWHCAFKFPFEYYVVKNEKGEPVKSYLDLQEIKNLPDNYDVGVFEYKGCPKFKREKKEEESLDDFLE